VIISSKISKLLIFSVSSLKNCKYSSVAGKNPPSPITGSRITHAISF
jgi:hypothetical protein